MHQLSLLTRSAARSIPKTLPFRPCLSAAAATVSSSGACAQLLPRRAPTDVAPKRLAPAHQCTWNRALSIQRRPYSSSTSTVTAIDSSATATSATQSPTLSSSSSSSPPALTWNRFLTLRKQRRRISLAASAVCALGSAATGMSALSAWDLDLTRFGLDPMLVLAGAFFASAGCGWLLGPSVGNLLFNLRFKGITADVALKEKQFYARIKKFRVDPSSSSMSNPVPDYYGEKIGSVTDYRRWLKDQRAFNLKRGKML